MAYCGMSMAVPVDTVCLSFATQTQKKSLLTYRMSEYTLKQAAVHRIPGLGPSVPLTGDLCPLRSPYDSGDSHSTMNDISTPPHGFRDVGSYRLQSCYAQPVAVQLRVRRCRQLSGVWTREQRVASAREWHLTISHLTSLLDTSAEYIDPKNLDRHGSLSTAKFLFWC